MNDIEFLSWDDLLFIHEEQLQLYGGQQGFIDEGVVRSVMSRAQFSAQYDEDADLADLSADYMYGFATTQGFMDGNKRTAVVASLHFLNKNGWDVIVTEKLLYVVAMAVANGQLDRDGLAEILRTHMTPIETEID